MRASKLTWFLSAGIILLYVFMPAFWVYLLVGQTIPASTVTMAAVWLTAFGCVIMTSMGYALGRAYPEDMISLDEWYHGRKDKE